MTRRPRVAIVGHVEWATHALGAFPAPGEIRSLEDAFEEPAGGGAVAAAQAAKLGAETAFFTALGADSAGDASHMVLAELGITIHAAVRPEPQTRAISVTGPTGDRAIALIGGPLEPRGRRPAGLGRAGRDGRGVLHRPRPRDAQRLPRARACSWRPPDAGRCSRPPMSSAT